MTPRSLCCALLLVSLTASAAPAPEPADLIIRNAKVLTVNSNFAIAQAVAIRGDKIVAVGKNRQIDKYKGFATRIVDAQGMTVLPGLYDGEVHSYEAAVSDLDGPAPIFHSLQDAHDYIVKQAAQKPAGHWIIIRHNYPTRLAENRLPTMDELDAAAPNNPVYWDCGNSSLVNSKAFEVSHITNGTPNPPGGEVVVDLLTSRRTGQLRNASSLLSLPPERTISRAKRHDALTNLFHLYNEQGITSIAERPATTEAIDFFRSLDASNELSVRINCSPGIALRPTVEGSLNLVDAFTNAPKGGLAYGPTGLGDDWVHIGSLGVSVDGELGFGTACLRTPYGIGPTYCILEPSYCGLRLTDPDIFKHVWAGAALRGWQLNGRCEGDAAVGSLLNCYEFVNFKSDITDDRFLITHASLQGSSDWGRCRELGVGASVQPALLYKDGSSLNKTLGEKRLRGFLALKTWFDEGGIAGAGSGHAAGLDPLDSVNPWSPWLGMWITLTRQTDQADIIHPEECLTRQQAIRLYTINNAWLGREDKAKGSLEPGKLADLILVDRDVLNCPVNDVKDTRVLLTVVGGKVVWEAKQQ